MSGCVRGLRGWMPESRALSALTGGDSVLEPGAPDRSLNSLSAFLCDQLDRRRLSGPLLALTKYMVQLLDEDGYLAQEDLDGLAELKIPQAMVEQALDILQSLEPAGVGARGLSECLVLQLSRQKNVVPHAMDIAARFLPELGRRHYGPIVKALGISMVELRTAEKAIAALEPRPGGPFSRRSPLLWHVRMCLFWKRTESCRWC